MWKVENSTQFKSSIYFCNCDASQYLETNIRDPLAPSAPVFKFPLVIIELDPSGVLHAAHDVDHVLLVDSHLAGFLFLIKNITEQ